MFFRLGRTIERTIFVAVATLVFATATALADSTLTVTQRLKPRI